MKLKNRFSGKFLKFCFWTIFWIIGLFRSTRWAPSGLTDFSASKINSLSKLRRPINCSLVKSNTYVQGHNGSIDAHWLKIQGRGYLKFLPISLGGSRLSGKIAREGLPISGFNFYCIFINKCFDICLWVSYIYPSPLPLPCVHLWMVGTLVEPCLTSSSVVNNWDEQNASISIFSLKQKFIKTFAGFTTLTVLTEFWLRQNHLEIQTFDSEQVSF